MSSGTSSGTQVRQALRSAALLQNRLAEALVGSGLTVDRWRALSHVAESPDSSMSDVADALVLPPASTTRVVDALVETGALYREVDPADRRRVVLRVSAQGADLLSRVGPAVHGAVRDEVPVLS